MQRESGVKLGGTKSLLELKMMMIMLISRGQGLR